MKRTASAVWLGNLKQGTGSLSTAGGALRNTPYGFSSRFENGVGTNPEELIAAAHDGCFTMATSAALGRAGATPEKLSTEATLTLEQVEGMDSTAATSRLRARAGNIEENSRRSPRTTRRIVRCRACSRPPSRWTRSS